MRIGSIILVGFAGLVGGCWTEDCPAIDVYTQRAVALDDEPEVAERFTTVRHLSTFVGEDGVSRPMIVEVEEVSTLDEVERSYCGDSELEGHVATVVATLDVTDQFSLALPARASAPAGGWPVIEVESGRHLADVTELALRFPPAGDMVAVGVEITTDCLDDRVLIGLWSVGEACMQQETCPIAHVEPIGSFARVVSPVVGAEVGECI